MKPQQQPNGWSCLPTAFATAIDFPVADLINAIGHDGSEIVHPNLRKPHCYRTFHPEEMSDVLLVKGYAITQITPIPTNEDLGQYYSPPLQDSDKFLGDRMWYYLSNYSGVLCGSFPGMGRHAVAWDGKNIYDSTDCQTKKVDSFNVEEFLIITKITITK